MSRIQLKNNQLLQVTNQEAERVQKIVGEAKGNVGQVPLSLLPLAIDHADGTWCGSISDYSQVFFDSQQRKYYAHYENLEQLQRFHEKHGYGSYEPKFEAGYGLLSVKDQYLIRREVSQLKDNGFYAELVPVEPAPEDKQRRIDYWVVYEQNIKDGKLIDNPELHGR